MKIRKIKEDEKRTVYESVLIYSKSVLGVVGERVIILYNKSNNNVFLSTDYLCNNGTTKDTATCITDELLDFITELKRKNGEV